MVYLSLVENLLADNHSLDDQEEEEKLKKKEFLWFGEKAGKQVEVDLVTVKSYDRRICVNTLVNLIDDIPLEIYALFLIGIWIALRENQKGRQKVLSQKRSHLKLPHYWKWQESGSM